MNIKQEAQLRMRISVLNTLAKPTYATIIAAIPGLAALIALFKTEVTNIETNVSKQAAIQKGKIKEKNEFRKGMTQDIHEYISKLKAFAINTPNTILYNEINYSQSKVMRMSDTKFFALAMLVYNRINTNAAALAAYNNLSSG